MTIDWLKDKVTGDKFCPITLEEAVIDNNGTALNTKLAAKLDSLVSGTNIKTINNTSLLGSGDISISAFEIIDIGQVSFARNGYIVSETVYGLISNSFDAGKIPIITAKLAGTPSLYTTFVIIDNVNSYIGYWHDNQESHRFATFEVDRTGGLILLNEDLDKLVSGTNIKTINNASILGSGDISLTPKVASTTDNAIVRFDGTAGNILNSGVTINDNNHVTASKFITSGGTSSLFVKGDGTLDNSSYLTSETSLSKGTTSGNGNAVTDISVSGHEITLTKGSTFLLEAYVEVNLGSITTTNELYVLGSSVYTQVDTIYSANKIPIVKATLASDNDLPISFLMDKIATDLYFGSCLVGDIGYTCALSPALSFIYRYALLTALLSGTSIKTINNTTLLDSGNINLVPKVSSTDNAIARFDGTNGNIQNSGVIIDDNNYLTASRFIKNGGTSSQYLRADGSVTEGIPVSNLTYPDIQRGQIFAESSMAMINTMRGNCFALLPPDLVIIEKTTDGGTTWVDAGITDSLKATLFLGTANLSSIPIPLLNGVKNKNCGVRITFTAMKYNVPANTSETLKYNYWNSSYVLSTERYNTLLNLYLWVSSSSDFIRTKIYGARGNDSNTWTEVTNGNMYLSGWSGGNYIKLKSNNYLFGGGTSLANNYWNYRIVCFTDGNNGGDLASTSTSSLQVIYRIQGFGYNKYTVPNNIMGMDHLYTWDSNLNMILPNKLLSTTTETLDLGASNNYWNNIYAKKFIIKNGTSSQFLKADGSVDTTVYAANNSPNLTGTPKAPTATTGTNTTQIATTAFVINEINNVIGDINNILEEIIGESGNDSEASGEES